MISVILEKLAKQQPLSPAELDELRLWGNRSEGVFSQMGGIIGASGALMENNAFERVARHRLEAAAASVTIQVPPDYDTIIIKGSGSITSANGGNVWAQFNGDTGSNYTWQALQAASTTPSAFEDTTDAQIPLGLFGTTGAGAGVNGSFTAEIIHVRGPWKKNVLAHTYTAEFNDLYLLGGTWQNTSPIATIEIFGTDNTLAKGTTNLAADSLITVYGLR